MGKTQKIIFTQEQLNEIVRLHDEEGLLNREIADIFGVSKGTINRRLAELGVQSRHPRLTPEREKMICNLYQLYQNKTIVSNIANVSDTTISQILKKNNINILSSSEVNRKYYVDDQYFDNINTSNKAYFLGLLFADGNISNEQTHRISMFLQNQDFAILKKMLDDMNSTYPLKSIEYSKKNPNWQDQVGFTICSKGLWNGLYCHGMYPNKSLIVQYPINMPSELDRHFIRGLLDGDGHIQTDGHHIAITGTEMILNTIKDIVVRNLPINCSVVSCSKNRNPITKDFKVYGRKQAYMFLNWIYQDAEMYIDRKYDTYINEYYNKVA